MSNVRTVLKRVVFYDMLSTPERGQYWETSVDSHISIPLDPGMGAVWAPNGYGKTFAFKLLNKMIHPSEYGDATVGDPRFWLGSFLEECYNEVREPTQRQSIGEIHGSTPTEAAFSETWRSGGKHRLIPFSTMLARFVSLDEDDTLVDVMDLWIQPDWSDRGSTCRTRYRSYSAYFSEHEELFSDFNEQDWEKRPWGVSGAEYRGQYLSGDDFEIVPWDEVHNDSHESISMNDFAFYAFGFLFDDQDLELIDLLDHLGIPGVHGYKVAMDMGGSENDPFLPVIPNLKGSCIDLVETTVAGYHPDNSLNWTEVVESFDTNYPPDALTFGSETRNLMEVMRGTHIWYVEVPKSVADGGLEGAQRLIKDIERKYQDRVDMGGLSDEADTRFFSELEGSINEILGHSEDGNPWARMVSIDEGADRPMSFRRPWGGSQDLREDTLSFGQKSVITTECWLSWLEFEWLDLRHDIRRCLILDEPEAGRSEYWIGLLADRIVDSGEEISGVMDKTLVVMSHREDLLRAVGFDGRFHVMQPSDVQPAMGQMSSGDGHDTPLPEGDEDHGLSGIDGIVGVEGWESLASPLEVIQAGVRLPNFAELGIHPDGRVDDSPNLRVLRLDLLREYCEVSGLPTQGDKNSVCFRLYFGLTRIFTRGVEGLSEKEVSELARITGYQLPKASPNRSSEKILNDLGRHALDMLWSGSPFPEEN